MLAQGSVSGAGALIGLDGAVALVLTESPIRGVTFFPVPASPVHTAS